ncbi:MAG: PKD domain-containing protein [Bacteroidia bacterium]
MKFQTSFWFLIITTALRVNASEPDAKKIPTNHHSEFIENKGQIIDKDNFPNPSVRYLFNSNGLNIQLRKNGFSYDTYKRTSQPPDSIFFHRVDIEFIGANANPQIISEHPSEDYTNYYTAGTPEEGVLNVRTFQKVTYKNLYEEIDLEFSTPPNLPKGEGITTARTNSPLLWRGAGGGVKYNFIIHPGADASQIRWKYKGAFRTTLKDEKIILQTANGNMEETIPESFLNETTQKINVNYISFGENEFGFLLPGYNKNSTLIIDPNPTILWGTYYGSSGDDYGSSIVLDGSNILVTGYTNSTSTIATSGAYQTTYGGGSNDAFVLKLSRNGSRIWATYYGGTSVDEGTGIVCDNSSNIYISGLTLSSGLATSGAYQTFNAGINDAFIAKFNSNGSRLWATYFGGDSDEWATGIALDASSNVFISGWTNSVSGIATSGAFQTTIAGRNDAFIAKFNSSGARQWASYWGGSYYDFGSSLATDTSGNVLLTGYRDGSSGIVTLGFVAKFNNAGNHIWDRYVGTYLWTESNSIVTDKTGNAFITGWTESTSNIATSGAYQISLDSGSAGSFIIKLNSSGNIIWGTYFGETRAHSIAIDNASQNIYITGDAFDFTVKITNIGSYQPIYAGGQYDAFIVKFNSSGSYGWGTYYGGSGDDGAYGVAVGSDSGGTSVYVTGNCSSDSNMTTSNGFQPVYGGGSRDAFIAKFNDVPCPHISPVINTSPSNKNCSGKNVPVIFYTDTASFPVNGKFYKWTGPNGFNSYDAHPVITNSSVNNTGSYIVATFDSSNGCRDTTWVYLQIFPSPHAGFTQNNLSECYRGNSFTFTDTTNVYPPSTIVSKGWRFSNGDTSTNSVFTKKFAGPGIFTIKLTTITLGSSCWDSVTKTINVYPQTNIGFTANNYNKCGTNNFLFKDTSTILNGIFTRKWFIGNATSNAASTIDTILNTAGNYSFKLFTVTDNGCMDTAQQNISVATPFVVPFAGYTQNNFMQCLSGNTFLLNDTTTILSGTISRVWNFGDGDTSTSSASGKSFTTAGIYPIKLLVTSDHNCKDSVTKTFTVYPQTNIGFTVNHNVQCLQNIFLFTDTSNVSNGSFTKLWRFGNGDTSTSSVSGKTYPAGSYLVKLNTTTNKGCVDSTQQSITVLPYPKPNAGYTQNNFNECFSGNHFILSDTSNISSGTISRLWDFGDGTNSVNNNFNKVFASAGTYVIKLFETSDHICTDSVIKTFTVYPQPVAGYTQIPLGRDAQCLSGNNFVLNDTSIISSGTFSRLWNFGDGDTSTSSVSHKIYAKEGTYTLKLLVTSNNNCSDSASKTVTVYPQTKIGFSVNSLNQCFSKNNFLFTDTSTISSGSFSRLWDFGDGNTSNAILENKIYTANGTYRVKLTTLTNNGCVDSVLKTISVYPKITAGFSVDDSVECLNGNVFLFNDKSTVPAGTYSIYWDLGDATTNTVSNFSKSYITSGNYKVQLKIVAVNNCTDSATHSIMVKPNPVKPQILSLTKTQIQSTFSANDFHWFLNNNAIANSNSQTIFIHQNGMYIVKVDSTNGCIAVSDPLNVTLFGNTQILVIPNPNNGNFTLDFISLPGQKQIELYDMHGKFLNEYSTSENIFEIDSFLSSGMYLLKIVTETVTFNVKVAVE